MCYFCSLVKASHMAITDFKKGREAQIYHVEKDLVNSPNDCHNFLWSLQEEGQGRRRRRRKTTRRGGRKIKNCLCKGFRRLKFF